MKKHILLSVFMFLSIVSFAQQKESKYQGEIQAGYAYGSGGSDIDHAGVSMINGIRFNDYLYTGIGVGVDYYYQNRTSFISLPVFVNVKGYLPISGKTSLFASLDCGYSIGLKNEKDTQGDGYGYYTYKSQISGFLITPSIGASFKISENKAVNLSLCYNTQNIHSKSSSNYTSSKSDYSIESIGFKIGYSF